MASTTLNYTGASQSWTVPSGVSSVTVECWGAAGGDEVVQTYNQKGGLGGYAKGTLAVTPGETLYIYVGGCPGLNGTAAGWNGGGSGSGGNSAAAGGGGTDVRQGGIALANRKIVAGGGGGASYTAGGGNGGGTSGGAAPAGSSYPGAGGTQTAGGVAAYAGYQNGSLGQGGGNSTCAGGGGGYYGGSAGQGGGGGSGYIGGVTAGTTTSGVRPGNGQVVISFDTPPNPPAITSPPNNGVINLNADQTIAFPFSDSDSGDSQSAYDVEWWDLDSTGARVGAAHTHSGTTPNQFWTAPAGTLTAGRKEMKAQSYDSSGKPSGFGASTFFTAAVAPPAPTFTAPVNGATISTSSYTATISAPDVIASRWRTVADNAGAPDTSTVYSPAVTIMTGDLRSHQFQFPVNNRTEHLQSQIENAAGLWSTWADSRNPISYTPPAAPTRTLSPGTSPPTITVAITNPTPETGQPAVAYNDIYVNDGDGKGWVRKATNVAANGTWVYRRPRSGVDYEPLIVVVAVATNGTSTASGPMA